MTWSKVCNGVTSVLRRAQPAPKLLEQVEEMGTLVAHAKPECQGWGCISLRQGRLHEVLYQWKHHHQFVQLGSIRFRQFAKSGPAHSIAWHTGMV